MTKSRKTPGKKEDKPKAIGRTPCKVISKSGRESKAQTSPKEKRKPWVSSEVGADAYCVTLKSPINIALVKYWGKAHEQLIIPSNNSLSLTINKAQLSSTTTLTLHNGRVGTAAVSLTLNGK